MEIIKDTPKEEILKIGAACNQCGHCCSFGGGYVIDEDIPSMAEHFKITIKEFKEKYLDIHEKFGTSKFRFKSKKTKNHIPGPCIFLGEDKRCEIHSVKALHCRVGNCGPYGEKLSIWYALNYFVDANNADSVRQWAIYLKTHPTIPGGELEDLVPDKEEREKILSFEILK